MTKDDTSVPLNDLNTSTVNNDSKPVTSKKRRSNSLLLKLTFILIFILIIILIAILIIVILRSYQTTCSPPPPTTTIAPKSNRIQLRTREPNKFWNEYHLPSFIKPLHYNITLQLLNTTYNITKYNETNAFYGLIKILFQTNVSTEIVVLHAKYLLIQSVSLRDASESNSNSMEIKINTIIYDTFYDYMILHLNKLLNINNTYEVVIRYSGIMTTNESGIISTVYNNVLKKQKSYLVYSKFEPIGARRTFPCFDEPDKKVIFTVNLIHEASYHSLSNMPVANRFDLGFSDLLFSENHWNRSKLLKLSRFQTTQIPMSIYLLAFVLLKDYDHIQVDRQSNKLVRIWFPNDMKSSAEIPLNYSKNVENFFERYFNFTSPLPKTDHVYLPDFLSGAMENWGLITYRDRHLLVSNKESAHLAKTSLMTIAHELAHFWFGNWITTKTWGEIWLNEGFATYFASYAYYQLTGLERSSAEALFLYERRQILNKDLKSNFSSVIVNVTDPIFFKSVFNPITYQKGQALLVWLESIMGELYFQKGIQNYIRKFAELNPTNEQFFDCMDEIEPAKNEINLPTLKDFFRPWLYRGGFPIVTVNYDLTNFQIIITQQSVIKNSSVLEKWPIYTTYKTSKTDSDSPIYFNDKKTISKKLEDNEFVVVNSNGKSYVRVNYSELLWRRIIGDLNSSDPKINQINKIVLLDDAFYFTENNNIDISITRGLIDSLWNETNVVPWLIFYYKIFDRMHDFFKDDASFIKFSQIVKQLSKNILTKTMNKNSDKEMDVIEDIEQRAIFTLNCEINNDEVINWMSKRFRSWIENPTSISLPKHLVNIILYYGMKTNDKSKLWTTLWKMLVSSNDRGPFTHGQIAIGLAGTSKPFYINKLLNHYLIPNSHRSANDKYQDFMNLVEWISKSTIGIVMLQRWIVKEYDRIGEYAFGDNLSKRDQINHMEYLISRICKSIYETNIIQPLINLHRKSSILKRTITLNNNWRENIGKKLLETYANRQF